MFTGSAFAASHEDLQDRIDAAKTVIDEIVNTPDNTIPLNILKQATCVAVIPSLKKGAFIVGAEYGQGVVTCRTGHGWSDSLKGMSHRGSVALWLRLVQQRSSDRSGDRL